MSDILARHVIEVFPEREDVDEYGNAVVRAGDPETDTPVLYRCTVQGGTTFEEATRGLTVGTTRRVLSRSPFPGGAQALVRHEGRLWDVMGEPRPYDMSPGTRHQTTRITARTPKGP